jgi:hypothetical protein
MAARLHVAFAATALVLGGCATTRGDQAEARDAITLSVRPCFGFCPVFETSVAPTGLVRFSGIRHTALLGERSRDVGPAAYRSIAKELAAFRPQAGTDAIIECTAAVSDTSELVVTWTDSIGRKASATVQSGCPGGRGQAFAKLLREIPARLGVAEWAKQTTRPGVSRG